MEKFSACPINNVEKQMIDDVIKLVKESILKRCKKQKCTDGEINASLYSIQDYLDGLNIFEDFEVYE